MKDYHVTITIKNNLLYKRMIAEGYSTAAELSRASGVTQGQIGDMLSLTLSLRNKRGEIRKAWLKVSKFLRCIPEDLLPAQHHDSPLKTNKGSVDMDLKELGAIGYKPSVGLLTANREAKDALIKAMDRLSPRHRKVLISRVIEGKILDEVAEELGVTRERVRQMEIKALGVLKHPSRGLKEHLTAINEEK